MDQVLSDVPALNLDLELCCAEYDASCDSVAICRNTMIRKGETSHVPGGILCPTDLTRHAKQQWLFQYAADSQHVSPIENFLLFYLSAYTHLSTQVIMELFILVTQILLLMITYVSWKLSTQK